MDDVDDGKASDPITELSSQSGWHLGVDSDSVYFDHRGSSILSDDFGWNSNFHHHHQQQQQTEIGSNLTEKIDLTSFINNRFDESGLRSSFLADASESEAAALPTAPVASKQSVSSSSCEDPVEKSSSSDVKPSSSSVSTSTSKKKGQKRIRQQRFAFMTKSEIDHLEDGYRWRKYGQKAVKNSPYPRSYYRCTNTKCTVKKRVERSSQDPTVVITTYEGQHCHHAVGLSRSGGIISINTTSQEGATFGGRQLGLIPSITSLPLYNPGGMQSMQVSAPVAVARSRPACTEFPPEVTQQQQPQQQQPNDDGLLGHILPPGMRNQLL